MAKKASKAKAKSNGKGKGKKVGRKPEVIKPAAGIVTYAKKELGKAKKGEQSACEAIRNTAKHFKKARRIELEAVFAKGFASKMNIGTVRRQIQEGRA